MEAPPEQQMSPNDMKEIPAQIHLLAATKSISPLCCVCLYAKTAAPPPQLPGHEPLAQLHQ